jgi:TPR repeat protein
MIVASALLKIWIWRRSRIAKQGSIDVQARVGEMYLKGIGIKQDFDKAFYWLLLAAGQNKVGIFSLQ